MTDFHARLGPNPGFQNATLGEDQVLMGAMQDWPLNLMTILDHAALHHGEQEIVTRTIEGPITRTNYMDVHIRARKVAKALQKFGIKPGDRVGTLALNTARHLETWYGIIGAGAVCHTLNPRLFSEQIKYIANHAEDRIIFLDTLWAPLLEGIKDELTSVEAYVFLTDREHMPETSLPNVHCYEDFVDGVDEDFEWVRVPEGAAAGLCYTSGTTGLPKGVLYSHRSNMLVSLMACMADGIALTSEDTVLPIVPMFHANAWALVYAVPMAGSKLVMPGMGMDGASIYELLEKEKVTITAAVPTIWMMLLNHLEQTGEKLHHLERCVIGGSAVPPRIMEVFEKDHDVEVIHAWGMTETSPIGTVAKMKASMAHLTDEQKFEQKLKQGRAPYLVEMKITDDEGNKLPWDGEKFGHLMVRGPFIAKNYFKSNADILDDEGFFDTGDVATIDEHGFMQITDRAKDVIKSGGEWISSIELENVAVGHEAVAEAAVIGLPHPKWDERPLLVVKLKEGQTATKEDVLGFLDGKIAKWWMPDDVAFVEDIPHTATGKIQKVALRDQFKDYVLPTAGGSAAE